MVQSTSVGNTYEGKRKTLALGVYPVREGVPEGIENPVDHVAFEGEGFEQTCSQLESAGYSFKSRCSRN